MKKKLIVLNAALFLGFSSAVTSTAAHAESLSNLNEKKANVHEKRTNVKADMNQVQTQINQLERQRLSVEEQLLNIAEDLEKTSKKIDGKNSEIQETNTKFIELKKDISVLQDRIVKRNVVLRERALSFQESGGGINYLQVLFGSSSFSNLIDRVNAVATIAEADREILAQHEKDKQDLVAKQKAVEKILVNLHNMKADLEKMKAQQKEQEQVKVELMKEIKNKKSKAEQYKMSLKEEEETLKEQEVAIQKAIELENSRMATLESGRNQAINGTSSSHSIPASSGTFIRPADGIITSTMGARWGTIHKGIDIAKRGTVPIVAAADGVVARSYYSNSYGNAVFISHSINGQLYTTVYAHMRTRLVSSGQVVKQGQLIGYMGSTGDSTGQHLHFEVHKGPWNPARSNAVNPLSYVSY